VRFRDVTYIWEVLLQVGFYASAIIIPLAAVPAHLHDWFFLNPIVQIVQDARHLLLQGANDITLWNTVNSMYAKAFPFALTIIICLVGFQYFRTRSKYFAEDI